MQTPKNPQSRMIPTFASHATEVKGTIIFKNNEKMSVFVNTSISGNPYTGRKDVPAAMGYFDAGPSGKEVRPKTLYRNFRFMQDLPP
jgi:hypothetical protein